MVGNHCPVAAGIGQRDDQSHATPNVLGQCRPLKLSRPKLRLEIGERRFDFDLHHLRGGVEHHVCRAPIRRRTHRGLEPDTPGGGQHSTDCLRNPHLPRVAQAHTSTWVEADR